jgi:acetyltransferase-like isoleucine patch superfamily enzyme
MLRRLCTTANSAPAEACRPFDGAHCGTVIGEGCRIGACSIVRDSELGAEVTVGPFTIVNTSKLEDGAEAGPFARLRMEDHLGKGAQVGNFVELKKTSLGAGTKAMHLAYLGDSEIGEDVNVGAGTITCNFDGAKKHATRIGDGAFVGSNSTLVAPVEIGPGAYLAAGSVITETVPADALFILIGAEPRTDWLPPEIERDDRGFVTTAADYVTSVPGVFAIGDVRAGSVKRVASAVGEGSVVIQHVHRYLAGTTERARAS